MLTRESFLERIAVPRLEKVLTPELGDNGTAFVYVRPLTGSEYERMILPAAKGGMSEKEAAARLCVAGACDANGNRIFKDEDWPQLIDAPYGWSAVLRIARAVAVINNLEGTQDPLELSETIPGSSTGSG